MAVPVSRTPAKIHEPAVDIRPNCFECQSVRTDRLCVQCNTAFCVACFKVVHGPRSLRRHELTFGGTGAAAARAAATQRFVAEQTMCRRHEDAELQYFCRPCGQAICGECKRERHDQHGDVVVMVLEV